MHELLQGLPEGDNRADGNRDDDQNPGDIFGAAKAIGITAGGGAPRQIEGDQQRDRVQAVADIMDVSASSATLPLERDNPHLNHRSRAQREQRQPYRANPLLVGAESRIAFERVVHDVPVQVKNLRQPTENPVGASVDRMIV